MDLCNVFYFVIRRLSKMFDTLHPMINHRMLAHLIQPMVADTGAIALQHAPQSSEKPEIGQR